MAKKTTPKRPKTPKAPDPATRSLEKLIKARGFTELPPEGRKLMGEDNPGVSPRHPFQDMDKSAIDTDLYRVPGRDHFSQVPGRERFRLTPENKALLKRAIPEWKEGTLPAKGLKTFLVKNDLATTGELFGLDMPFILDLTRDHFAEHDAQKRPEASAPVIDENEPRHGKHWLDGEGYLHLCVTGDNGGEVVKRSGERQQKLLQLLLANPRQKVKNYDVALGVYGIDKSAMSALDVDSLNALLGRMRGIWNGLKDAFRKQGLNPLLITNPSFSIINCMDHIGRLHIRSKDVTAASTTRGRTIESSCTRIVGDETDIIEQLSRDGLPSDYMTIHGLHPDEDPA